MTVSGPTSTPNLILHMLYSIPGVLLFLKQPRDCELNLVTSFFACTGTFGNTARINVNESIDHFQISTTNQFRIRFIRCQV